MVPTDTVEFLEGKRLGSRLASIEKPLGYSFRVILRPEQDGGFSAFVPELPGAVSQGETVDEATMNMKDALVGLVEAYGADAIPFTDGSDYQWQVGDIETRIPVDVQAR